MSEGKEPYYHQTIITSRTIISYRIMILYDLPQSAGSGACCNRVYFCRDDHCYGKEESDDAFGNVHVVYDDN
jgi:hypothetical protein